MIDTLLSAIAPHLCCSCGAIGAILCTNCKSYIISLPTTCCWLCGGLSDEKLCDDCGRIVDGIYVVGQRVEPLQLLIGGFKFRYMRSAARELADLLKPLLPQENFLIIPIPTSRPHIRQRGYDHMALVAQELGKLTGCLVTPLLETRATHTQHTLSRHERLAAMHNVFAVTGTLDESASYLLVDDVITTGSTLLRAASCLRQAGARRILVAAIARQPSTNEP